MKFINKLFALTIIAALMLTLAACGKDKGGQNSKPDDTSKPTVSTPSENKTPNESEPDESKPENNNQDENKPDPKPEPDPEPVKKTAKELIIGKWTAKTDISSDLADAGINVEGPLEITLYTEFTTSGTLIEKADKNQMSSVLRTVLRQAIDSALAENNMTAQEFETQIGMTIDEYIETIVTTVQNSYTVTADYKFAEDVLLVKFEGDQAFTETKYEFINDNTLKIYTDSDETVYTRVK